MDRAAKLAKGSIVLGAVLLVMNGAHPISVHASVEVGDPAPDFTLEDVYGESEYTLSDLRGYVVYLAFTRST